TAATAEDTPVSGNVLANDSDADGDALNAILVSGPAHGSLSLNPDGSFTYTPNANYNGPDSFSYKANDGGADSNVATLSINHTPGPPEHHGLDRRGRAGQRQRAR